MTVATYALDGEVDTQTLRQWLARQTPAVVITLGRAASSAYTSLEVLTPQIAGLLDISPQTHPHLSGISLSVDPEPLFSTLKQLAPDVNRVFTVYNPDEDRWIIQVAKAAATRHGLELVAFKARDLKTSAQHFLKILKRAHPKTEAIWLPLDSTLMSTRDVLPTVIEESWRRGLIVFSGNLLHVDLGVLFALYPDNEALGQELAEMARQLAATPTKKHVIEPLRVVKRAVNLRVAAHLGLRVDDDTQQTFDLIFPVR